MNTLDTPDALPPLVVIAGPTASGKSSAAIAIAERLHGTVINADSMQVYGDLRVLTARPSVDDEARVPHRLFGYINGAEACSAARWAADASKVIAEVHVENRVPVLVGGTGMYIRTLLDGIAPVPEINAEVRRVVRALAVSDAYAALQTEDPSAAARLAPNDTTRVARALEVVRSSGRTLNEWQRQRAGGIAGRVSLVPVLLHPPREALNLRIDARFDTIFDEARAEVAALVGRALDPRLPVMRAIGVCELAGALSGELPEAMARSRGMLATRQYAKRQSTWFTGQVPDHWSAATSTAEAIEIILRQFALTP